MRWTWFFFRHLRFAEENAKLRARDKPSEFVVKHWSKIRRKDRSCYDMHPSLCVERDKAQLKGAKKFHREITSFLIGCCDGKHGDGPGYELLLIHFTHHKGPSLVEIITDPDLI